MKWPLIDPEDISSSSPVAPHYAGTEMCDLSEPENWSNKYPATS